MSEAGRSTEEEASREALRRQAESKLNSRLDPEQAKLVKDYNDQLAAKNDPDRASKVNGFILRLIQKKEAPVSVEKVFDKDSWLSMVLDSADNSPIPAILKNPKLQERRVAVDLNPTQLSALVRGERPDGVDDSQWARLQVLRTSYPADRLIAASSYLASPGDKAIGQTVEERRQAQLVGGVSERHYTADKDSMLARETQKLLEPYFSPDGQRKLAVLPDSSKTIYLFFGLQKPNAVSSPVKFEEIANVTRQRLGQNVTVIG